MEDKIYDALKFFAENLMYFILMGCLIFLIGWGMIWLFKKITLYEDTPRRPITNPNDQSEWLWDYQNQRWVHESEVAKQIQVNRDNPSFEEWKEKKNEDSTYHYSGKDLPKEEAPKEAPREQEYTHRPVTPPPGPTQTPPQAYYTKDRYVMPRVVPQSSYRARPLLTQNEWIQFQKLINYAAEKNLGVLIKMRLADLVDHGHGRGAELRFNKIKAKHVDFVLVDARLQVRAILELDDPSHDRPDRQKRDHLVDSILSSCGYTIIHTRNITKDTLNGI